MTSMLLKRGNCINAFDYCNFLSRTLIQYPYRNFWNPNQLIKGDRWRPVIYIYLYTKKERPMVIEVYQVRRLISIPKNQPILGKKNSFLFFFKVKRKKENNNINYDK